jgi:arylsulfatase A
MNRRQFLAMSAASAGGLLRSYPVRAAERPPNIVLILIDDLGSRDLACYGGEVFETPNIDRLASEGMRFTQAYSNCPVCSPSRAAIMTGKNPARLGFTGHITAIREHRHPEGSRLLPPKDKLYLPLEEITIAEALKPAGYISANIGKWHLGDRGFWPEEQGFDVNIGGWTAGSPPSYFFPYTAPEKDWNPSIPTLHGGKTGEYLTDRLTDESIAFVKANQDRPFFLYLPHYAVHTPLQAPEALVEKYRRKFEGKDIDTKPEYAAMVENMDTNIGRLLTALHELGLDDDTVVIFTSDNGCQRESSGSAPLREGKGFLYEGGIRVPLIIKWPGKIAPATLCDVPTIGCDLNLTILDIAGQSAHAARDVDGVSLAPLWNGAKSLPRESLIWYYPHYYGEEHGPSAAIRKGNLKLIETYDPPGVELYDVAHDISEKNDLAKQMPEKATALKNELNEYIDGVKAIRPALNPDYTTAR